MTDEFCLTIDLENPESGDIFLGDKKLNFYEFNKIPMPERVTLMPTWPEWQPIAQLYDHESYHLPHLLSGGH